MRLVSIALCVLLVAGVPALRAQDPNEGTNGSAPARVEPPEVRQVDGWNGDAAESSARPSRRLRRKRSGPDVGLKLKFDRPVEAGALRNAFTIEPRVAIYWDDIWQESKTVVRVPAALKPGQKYAITITEVPPGGRVRQWVATGKHEFTVPGGPPSLSFTALGGVVERKSRQLVHLILRNTEMIRVEATNVPLLALIPGAPELPTTSAVDPFMVKWAERSDELKPAATGPFAGLFDTRSATEKEVFPEPGSRDRERRESVPLAWRSNVKGGGTFLVRAVSLDPGETGSTPLQTVQITDLALSWKVAKNELLVWTTSLSTGEVVPGARVFIGLSDGKLLAAGETDADGLVRVKQDERKEVLDLAEKGAPAQQAAFDVSSAARVFGVTADDTSWGDVAEQRVAVSGRIEQEDKEEVSVRAHAFTERGVYRPGDTVRFKTTLRSFQDGKAAAPAGAGSDRPSCLVTVTDPKGRRTREIKIALSAFGTAWGTLPTRASDPLGEYSLDVKTLDGKQTLGNTTYRVEEFLPPRHKVEISFKEKAITINEGNGPARKRSAVEGIIKAMYYAGGPVKHGKVRWRVELSGTRHDVGAPGYVAGTDILGGPALLESGEAMLDATGGVVVEVPLSPDVTDGRRSLALSATVLDFDARAATASGKFAVKPPVLVGISAHPDSVDNGQEVDLIAIVTQSGKRVETGELTVTVLEENWTSVQKRNDDGDFYWTSEAVLVRAYDMPARLTGGVAPINIRFHRGGNHHVQVAWKAPGGSVYRSTTAFDVSWSDSDAEGENWQAEKLRRVSLTSDRTEYVPGETARLRIRAPRAAASMILTVERDGILSAKRIALKPGEPDGGGRAPRAQASEGAGRSPASMSRSPASGESIIEVPIDATCAPNVYVSVLAAHGREAFPLYAAEADTQAPGYSVGYVSLPVRTTHTELKVALTGAGPDARAVPRARHKVGVSVKDREGKPVVAEVALAVVDESVLALTDYKTPSLARLFEVLLPLGVKTSDLRNALSLQTPYRSFLVRPLTGGDGGNGQNRAREWFDPVAFFQPDLVTDANGEASVEFTLPDSMTAYRVFAVAVDKGASNGSAAAPLVVRKAFYLEAGLPRFFTVGDKGKFTVAVFNGTPSPAEVELEVKAQGGLVLKVPAPRLTLNANDRGRIPVEFLAQSAGHVKLEFSAKLGTDSDAVVLGLPVRSRYVRRTQAVDGALDGGAGSATIKLALPADAGQLPEKEAREAVATLSVSTLSALRLMGGLESLLHYPYGCIEQTSSGLLPLAALREMIGKGLVPRITLAEADHYIRPGVERILSMQTQDGGFGYWPGNADEHPWGSAYATLALVWAKNAGVSVPEAELGRALDYLERLLKDKDAAGKPVGADNTEAAAQQKARALAHFALAAAGRAADPARDLKGALLTQEDALLMCMAMARTGQSAEAKKELARVGSHKNPLAFDPWTFYSPVRARAIELLAALEVDPKGPRVTALTAELLRALKPSGSWYTTQDNAWCVTAVGRASALNPPGEPDGGGRAPRAQASEGPGRSPGSTPIRPRASGGRPLKGEIRAGGGTPATFSLGEKQPRAPSAKEATHVATLDAAAVLRNPSVELARDGTAPLFYRLEVTYPWRGPDAGSRESAVTRTYKRLAGEGAIRLGDLVEVTLAMKLGEQHSYVAVADPLPAGLVAINSALSSEGRVPSKNPDQESGWEVDGRWTYTFDPDHLELRDDRVQAFRDHVWKGPYRFSYVARAVCEGTFVVPPVKVEPMYQPEHALFSAETGLTIEAAAP